MTDEKISKIQSYLLIHPRVKEYLQMHEDGKAQTEIKKHFKGCFFKVLKDKTHFYLCMGVATANEACLVLADDDIIIKGVRSRNRNECSPYFRNHMAGEKEKQKQNRIYGRRNGPTNLPEGEAKK